MSVQTELTIDRPRRAPRTIPDRVLGALGGAMVFLAALLLIRSAFSGSEQPLAPPPLLALLEPAPESVVEGPLVVHFDVQAQLVRQPEGWGYGGYHLHLQLDGMELMPGAADVSAVRSGGYRWVVGPLEPGAHRLQLFWADGQHRPVEEGRSEVVEVEVR